MKITTFNIILLAIICGCSNPRNEETQIDDKIEQDTLYDILRAELVDETEDTYWFKPYENSQN